MRGWAPQTPLLQLLVTVLILSITMSSKVGGDPANLVSNGDFEDQYFNWDLYPQMDVLNDGSMNFIPSFTVISGGIQVVNGLEYVAPVWEPGSYLIHLNCWQGPGSLETAPLATPRWGATYNLSFDLADNPDGGPINKGVAVHILVNEAKTESEPSIFNVSNPESHRRSIIWQTVIHTFVGTGQHTTIVFESLTQGSFGVLIDNVRVSLVNLLDNGSFDNLNPPGLSRNLTFFSTVQAPSDIIRNWFVTDGAIKWAGTERWHSSTDESFYLLDMNANGGPGTIISGKVSLRKGAKYVVLFDSAANPDSTLPLRGTMILTVQGVVSGDVLASRSITIDGSGFSAFSIGWRTERLEFPARETEIYLTFSSKIPGDIGPLLDNVAIYQVSKVGPFTARGGYALLKSKAIAVKPLISMNLCWLLGSVCLLLWI
ncbi:hypothetical protein R1flu_025720 [Riccia fluitans]|uniref:DUF642 domain-containing protein n=1 Tax=Riccia fluitans TaxID=41844 RepID=A0ABD1XZG9_9MARC